MRTQRVGYVLEDFLGLGLLPMSVSMEEGGGDGIISNLQCHASIISRAS